MNATAAAIHAHRHTVGARLERLAVLTRLDPTLHDDRERLALGVKAFTWAPAGSRAGSEVR